MNVIHEYKFLSYYSSYRLVNMLIVYPSRVVNTKAGIKKMSVILLLLQQI